MQWSARIHTRFHVSGATLDTHRYLLDFNYGPLTLYDRPFQIVRLSNKSPCLSPNPVRINPNGLGCSPFARHYLGNRIRFLFLCLLRCFTSAGVALSTLFIHVAVTAFYRRRVSPFGYLRVKACLRLTEAFRSLPRPSSPCVAKASSCCPLLFDNNSVPFLNMGYHWILFTFFVF